MGRRQAGALGGRRAGEVQVLALEARWSHPPLPPTPPCSSPVAVGSWCPIASDDVCGRGWRRRRGCQGVRGSLEGCVVSAAPFPPSLQRRQSP
jgi:hypothetical protein